MADFFEPIQFRSPVEFKEGTSIIGEVNIPSGSTLNVDGDIMVGSSGKAIVEGDFTINGTINATCFNASSDRRLKKNIKPFQCKKSILDLPIYEFDYINSNVHTIGCLAQELQEICPELVEEGTDGFLKISEIKLIYLLIQELKRVKENG